MELIGERQSLWLHHTRCNCTETLRRNRDIPFFTLNVRGTIKTIEAIFQLGPFEICLLSFFFLFYPSLIRGWSSSFPLDFSISSPLFSFFLFVFVSRVERQFELSSRIREDPVFKGIKGDSWRTTCGDFDEPYRGFRLLIIDVTRSPLLFI